MVTVKFRQAISKGLLCTAMAVSAGCASIQPPSEQMATAKKHVVAARSEGAHQHAYLALMRAEQKLENAEVAFAEEDFEAAKRFAEQAAIDARVARTEASTVKLKAALKEVNESIQLLQDELKKRS